MDEEITIEDCLGNLNNIIQKYKDYGGMNLEDSYFLFLGSGELGYSAAIFYKDDLDYSLSKNDLDITATKRITIFDKKLYRPNGSFIDFKHKDFFTKPLLALEKNSLLDGWVFPHELNHIGFNKVIPINEYAKKEGNQAELMYVTLIEGIAMVTSPEFCLSKTSLNASKELLDCYLKDEEGISSSLKKWGEITDSELIACSKNRDRFFYYVGTNFVNKIIRPKEKFVSLLERIRENYPTAKDILNPMKYLERIS